MKDSRKGQRCSDELEFEKLKEAKRRNDVIQKYLNNEITYKSALGLIPCSRTTFYRLLHKFDEGAGSIALLQTKRGRKKGQSQLDEAVETIIKDCIKSKLTNRAAGPTIVWKAARDKCIESSLPVPSRGAVSKRVNDISPLELRKLQYGAADAYDKLGMKPGKLKLNRPLQVTQLDHTLVDVILCDDDRTPLGRPWLTVLIDVHTRVILSYYLAWHHPSSVSVAATIAFAVADKANYLSIIDCEHVNYPFSGKPEAINSDNAKEFRALSMEKACAKNKIDLNWRPRGRKHYGGHVERLIGSLMGEVHFLPGTTFSNTKIRKGYDSEARSCMTFLEFSRWFAMQVAIYHCTVHSGIRKTPGDAWVDYFGAHSPNALTNNEKAELTIDFLPQARRTIYPKGLRFKNNYYYCPDLTPHAGKDVLIKYNPLSMRRIWAHLNGEYISVPFSDLAQNDNLLEVSRINGMFQELKSEIRWVSDLERIKLEKASDELVVNSQAKTKKERRQRAIDREHGAKLPVKINPDISVDYSKKPKPFNSED
jgi:putative transposase